MVTNTVQTLIDEVKDLSGQTNLGVPKAIRALNRGADSLSTLSLIASGRNKNDSRNHGDISRVTTTVEAGTEKVLLEDEVMTLQQLDVLVDGKYQRVDTIDRRDNDRVPLDTTYSTPGVPKYYDREGNHLYLYPSTDQEYTLRLTYGRPHPRFTEDNLTQDTGMLPLHEEYVVAYAADIVMIGMSDSARAQVANKLIALERKVVDTFKNQDEDRAHRIRPKQNNAFNSRFMTR